MRLQRMSKSTIFVTIDATIFHDLVKRVKSMNRWIVWTITFVIFSRLHTNIKLKTILNINIVNFLIIHVVIDFNWNHYKNLK
jgi:signal recognition particle GTPase